MIAARILACGVALVIAAWLGLEAIGAHGSDELLKLALAGQGPLSPQQRERAQTLIARADRLNPDTRPEQIRGIVALRDGDVRGAVAIFARLTRTEPENPEGWALLARAAASYDPRLAASARSRVLELAPPVPR
jgi:predicted Zn-dependent protease